MSARTKTRQHSASRNSKLSPLSLSRHRISSQKTEKVRVKNTSLLFLRRTSEGDITPHLIGCTVRRWLGEISNGSDRDWCDVRSVGWCVGVKVNRDSVRLAMIWDECLLVGFCQYAMMRTYLSTVCHTEHSETQHNHTYTNTHSDRNTTLTLRHRPILRERERDTHYTQLVERQRKTHSHTHTQNILLERQRKTQRDTHINSE